MRIIKQKYMHKKFESEFAGKKILDLGCGENKFKNAIGVDRSLNTDADVIYDLNLFPYPFKDDKFDFIICKQSIEHLLYSCKVMEEIYRILKPNGVVILTYPHFSSYEAYMTPEHINKFSCFSFENPSLSKRYNTNFKTIRKKIYFGGGLKTILGIESIANRFPEIYEKHFAFILPAIYVEIWLRAIK